MYLRYVPTTKLIIEVKALYAQGNTLEMFYSLNLLFLTHITNESRKANRGREGYGAVGRNSERWRGTDTTTGRGGKGQGAVGRDRERWEEIGSGKEGQGEVGRVRERWNGTARGGER